VNNPPQLRRVLAKLEEIQAGFGKPVSMADLIVLGGCAAVEAAAKAAGHDVTVPFTPGRTDATEEMTDADSFAPLEPKADAWRNYVGKAPAMSAEALMVDRAQLLTLSAPEMSVLVGGMRVLGTNFDGSDRGVFTDRAGSLTNDFFVNVLDLSTEWSPTSADAEVFEGRNRATGEVKWTGTRCDLIFGANSQLRAISEIYGASDGGEKFVADFVTAWNKVMELDRFDLR
jgi:catalase-peroxidase